MCADMFEDIFLLLNVKYNVLTLLQGEFHDKHSFKI